MSFSKPCLYEPREVWPFRWELDREAMDYRTLCLIEFVGGPQTALPPPVEFLAEKLEVTAPRVRRLFREKTGQNYSRFVMLWRLRVALDLLKSTCVAAKEVEARAEFRDACDMDRAFQRHLQIAPIQYRKEMCARRLKARDEEREKNNGVGDIKVETTLPAGPPSNLQTGRCDSSSARPRWRSRPGPSRTCRTV